MLNSNINKSGNATSTLFSSIIETEKDCSICMEKFIYPCQLECGHIFCYLCIKGFASLSNKCALCRAPVNMEYFKKPNIIAMENEQFTASKKHVWYYEGRNGWWEYDSRTNNELENEYKSDKKKKIQLLITGSLYVIDFENKVQYRLDDPNKKRRIKRDLKDINSKKGVAGIINESKSNNESDNNNNFSEKCSDKTSNQAKKE